MMKQKVFFLGGYDLEMETIKALLESRGIGYVDHKLSWANADLSSYNDDFARYPESEYDIYGVELRCADGVRVPSNYHLIDHHGDMDFMPSSLEQVADLLGHGMSLDERLVAANDRGYVTAMRELLADNDDPEVGVMSDEQKTEKICEIRKRDRMAQGVTPEEEAIADKEIKAGPCFRNERLIMYHTSLRHFSPITDRVELGALERLVVYNDHGLAMYGMRARLAGDAVSAYVRINMEKPDLKTYSGGGDNGFWGIPKDELTTRELVQVTEFIKTMHLECSGHIFYFPFTWEDKDRGLENLRFKLEQWHKADPDRHDSEVLYNEKNYFYKYVHKTLYDDDDSSVLRHFELKISKGARYGIKVRRYGEDLKYSLKVDSVNLNMYSTGVGLLSFYLTNDTNTCISIKGGKESVRHMDHNDILRINQYGRRIMPPFYNELDENSRVELAKEIVITGLDGFGELREDFKGYGVGDSWKPASFIVKLIDSLSPGLDFKPVIDDRMFVMTWYKDTEVLDSVRSDTVTWDHSESDHFWYRFLFVDADLATCHDAAMRASLINASSYKRWLGMGSIYGITRYSMVFLATDTAPDHLTETFRTIYARMVELVLMQRASLLNFSYMVTKVSDKLETGNAYEDIRSLYRKYIIFVNQFYHRDVTAQDQGIELYELMQKALRMDELVKDLDNDIGELYQYISMVDDKEQGKKADLLNIMMGLFAPASLITGIWGMNSMCDVMGAKNTVFQMLTIVGSMALAIIIMRLIYKKKK